MARFSEAKKLEAVEAVKGGTPTEDVAKKYGVREETLQGWTGTARPEKGPKVVQLKPKGTKARGGAKLPRAKAPAGTTPSARIAPTDALKAMSVMWKSGLPREAFAEALALLEG